ncbi:MAG: hypothetical protein AVDCRST_MAG62-1928 [uncultured Sphingomonas sp.]|uniref:Putative auto-transporter adhesin head GIN domain-containing protein n=1 Tax=uncultured Sphingomonas sp. TaxID=158754 RepID=A0A6J4TTF3_9SPHN|nr:MAG: hypothetical protein AVDCRST_MAG62-1928 [uncultured Sphingomonas sp.]
MTRPILAAAVLLSLAAPASAAQRNYTVTSFDRIRVDGPYSVRLSTGVAPFARATGSTRALDGISVRVEGRTLTIRRDQSAWSGYPNQAQEPVELVVGTHDLTLASLNGAGTLSIDKVRGLTFELSAQGAGRADIGDVHADRLVVALSGTVTSRVAGKALKLTAIVRGASSLDASALRARDGLLSAEGPAQLTASLSDTARVDAAGVAQVTVAGNPACTVKLLGSANVSGCAAKR